jgi:hypothetical protein
MPHNMGHKTVSDDLEVVVGKLSIVTVVMLDPDAVLGSKLFECLLGYNSFQQGEIACHEVNKYEP